MKESGTGDNKNVYRRARKGGRWEMEMIDYLRSGDKINKSLGECLHKTVC